ncbi:MAG: HAD family hydrolase [Thermovirgaceae bacterium]
MTGVSRTGKPVLEIAGRTKNVLFDFDMTLIDSSAGVAWGLQRLSRVFSLRKPPKEEVFRTIGLPMRQAMEALWGECREEWLLYYRENISSLERKYLKLLPGVTSLLETLKSMDIACGVVSNRGSLKNLIGEFDLEGHFQAVLVLNDGLPPKPDPAPLLFAMKRLNAEKDETIYVGDSVIDVETSRRAGIPCFAVSTGSTRPEVLVSSGAIKAFDSCLEIETLFRMEKAERARVRNE